MTLTNKTDTKTVTNYDQLLSPAQICRHIEARDGVAIFDTSLPLETPEPVAIHDQETWLACTAFDPVELNLALAA